MVYWTRLGDGSSGRVFFHHQNESCAGECRGCLPSRGTSFLTYTHKPNLLLVK